MLHKGCLDKLCTKMYLWGPQLMAYTAFGSKLFLENTEKGERMREGGIEGERKREREKEISLCLQPTDK